MGLWATSVEDSEKRNLQSKELLRKSLLSSKDWEILVGNQDTAGNSFWIVRTILVTCIQEKWKQNKDRCK